MKVLWLVALLVPLAGCAASFEAEAHCSRSSFQTDDGRSFTVDGGADELQVLIEMDRGNPTDFTIRDPDGDVAYSDGFDGDGGTLRWSLDDPVPGTWHIDVDAGGAVPASRLDFSLAVRTGFLDCDP